VCAADLLLDMDHRTAGLSGRFIVALFVHLFSGCAHAKCWTGLVL